MGTEYMLYGKVAHTNVEELEFVGTMSELCEYAGVTPRHVRSYIYNCRKKGKFCPYVIIGRLDEEDDW